MSYSMKSKQCDLLMNLEYYLSQKLGVNPKYGVIAAPLVVYCAPYLKDALNAFIKNGYGVDISADGVKVGRSEDLFANKQDNNSNLKSKK